MLGGMDTRAAFSVTDATVVHRRPERASYDRAFAYSILDEALYASVAFVADGAVVRRPVRLSMDLGGLGDRKCGSRLHTRELAPELVVLKHPVS